MIEKYIHDVETSLFWSINSKYVSNNPFILKKNLYMFPILKLQLPTIPANVTVSATGHGIGHIQVSKLSKFTKHWIIYINY